MYTSPMATEFYSPGANDIIEQLRPLGLTFYKNYNISDTGSLGADFALGDGSAIFTRTNVACTYINGAGLVITNSTTNLPRIQGGYYDTTGFHASSPGILIEATGTNQATFSGTTQNAAWTKVNITANDADNGSTSPDGTSTAISLTSTLASSNIVQAYVDAVAGVYTSSLWIKRKTGSGTINLRANILDGYTDITSSVGSGWTRVSVSSSSLTNPAFDLQIVTSGDALYVYGLQLEKNSYMTSYIPNATTANTRGTEVLKYAIAGNRTAAQETIVVKFSPIGNFANDGLVRFLTDTDTVRRELRKDATKTVFTVYPAGLAVRDFITTMLNNNTYLITTELQATGDPNVRNFISGIQDGIDENTDFTANAWGSSFYLGVSSLGGSNLNGIIKTVAFFSRILSTSEVLSLNSSI